MEDPMSPDSEIAARSLWSSFGVEESEEVPIPDVMPQAVHLQYNTPMGLYSKESAREQFEQQIGAQPGDDLPAADKHFDPSKSATLKYLKEGGGEDFGANFFEKVADAEAPNVPQQSEPGWARMAREKSERARSKTPADPIINYSSEYTHPAPLCHPVHADDARQHAEKNKVFTHNIHETTRPYYEAAATRDRRSHSVGARSEPRGYELGGIDYTKGMRFDDDASGAYYWQPRRREEKPRTPAGYEMGGTDFYRGHTEGAENYRGHGPDPPRLRSKYSANPHDPCNVAMAPNIEAVDANLLVGDTISNQKANQQPQRRADPTQFGTAYSPAPGFRRDHITVRHQPPSSQPPTFSISANRSLSCPRSNAPHEQHDVWNVRQQQTDKETYISEPNWRRNVDQRRQAWERRAFENEQRLSRPYSEKIAPAVPPAWHAEAEHKHRQWQQQANDMSSYQDFNQSTTQTYNQQQQQQQQYHQPQGYNQQQQNNYSSMNTQQQQQQNYQSSHGREINHPISLSPQPANLINTGYNTNQVDYVKSHADKYSNGVSYHPPIINQSQQQSWQNNSNHGSSRQYHEERIVSHNNPIAQAGTFNEAFRVVDELPLQQEVVQHQSSHTTTTNNSAIPLPAVSSNPGNYSTSYHTETHSSTGPVVMHSPGGQSIKSTEFSSSRYNKQEKTTTTTTSTAPRFLETSHRPVESRQSYNYEQREVSSAPQRANVHSDSFTTHVQQVPAAQHSNYLSSHHRKEETTTTSQSRPVSQLSQYSESRNYKRNYSEKTETTTVPAAPQPTVTYKDLSNAQSVDDVFNKKTEMNEKLPTGSIFNTHNNTEGGYRDASGHDVHYKRETQTSADPGRETALLKEEEKRVIETPLEPGVISRHVTTKYYKKKTVTDTTTTTEPAH